MTQMSLVTAAKEGIGSGPHHRSRQYLFLCREGVFSSRPQMGGIDWVQLCFSVWECLVGWHLGWGWGSPRLSGDRPLSSARTGTASRCLSQLILFLFRGLFSKTCPQIRKKHERLCPTEGMILAAKASWHPTSIPDSPFPQLSVQLLIM